MEDRGNKEVQITEMRKSLCGPVVVIVCPTVTAAASALV